MAVAAPGKLALGAVLRSLVGDPALEVEARLVSEYASTFPAEIVDCRLGDGSLLRLFCKYGVGTPDEGYGHKAGVEYEAEVYERVLAPSGASVPRFIGSHVEDGVTWLVLEYLDRTERLRLVAEPKELVPLAAGWIGRFHATAVPPADGDLAVYDEAYFRDWATRTLEFATPVVAGYPWLERLCASFDRVAAELASLPRVVVHGEYTLANVLVRDGVVHPTDWESAALGPGEIDLAFLTDRWPKISPACERAYCSARWPDGGEDGFERRLLLARLYTQFRWLGDRPEWTTDRGYAWRFGLVRACGEQLGLLS